MPPTITPAPNEPPNPWMYVRLMRPGEERVMFSIDAHLRQALATCDRCTGIYQQTGLIPVSCHICGATRDELWLACIEDQARKQPHIPGRSQTARAAPYLPYRRIE